MASPNLREDPHIQASLMHEVKIADCGSTNRSRSTTANTTKDTSDNQTSPRTSMASKHVAQGGKGIAGKVYRTTAVHIRYWRDEERTNAGKKDVHRQLV